MGIPLTGTQSVFERMGHIFGLLNVVNAHRGVTVPPHINTINSDYSTTDQKVVTNIYSTLLSYQNSLSILPSALQQVANNTITTMANDSQAQTSNTSLSVNMQAVINQMLASGSTVQQCTLSDSIAAGGSNAGNAVVTISLKRGDGLVNENSFAELIAGNVTSDSQSGTSVAGRESIKFLGQYAISDSLSWLYPVGSGCSFSLNCIDGSQSNGRGTQNNLNNSNFELWTTPNIPNGWHITTGTAGTTILQSSGTVYDGTWSLEFAGNGSELTTVYQQFATFQASGDTTSQLAALTQYAVNGWVCVNSAPAGGVLQFALVDESNTIINDEQGNANSFTINLTTIGTSFVAVNGFFRTPRVLPSSIRLQISLSTALTSGHNVFIDRVAMAQPTIAYVGGPSVAAFSGNVPLVIGDTYTLTINNNYGGQFQTLFDRFFNMKSLGYLLPSSNSPTIPDSLIT